MKFNFKFLFIACSTILLFSECRKSYIRHHYEGQFNCVDHYFIDDSSSNLHSEGTENFTTTISIDEDCPPEYEDSKLKTVLIKIQTDGSIGKVRTEISRDGTFNTRTWDDENSSGSFSGGFTDDNHYHYILETKKAGYYARHIVDAVRK